MLDINDKKALQVKSEDCFILAECFFDRAFSRPEYLFNQRGKSAGTAHLQRNLIKFNPILFTQNKQEFIDQVVPHEVAHIIAYQQYGKVKPHGKEWQHIMEYVFHRPATTTHTLDIKDVVGKQYRYQCLCDTHLLTIRRHNNILKGTKYICKKCGEVLSQTTK